MIFNYLLNVIKYFIFISNLNDLNKVSIVMFMNMQMCDTIQFDMMIKINK